MDLVPYRNAILNMFQHKGLQAEYEVVSMEGYVSESGMKALDVCLSDVREADIYILILAKRYGSIVEDTGISYTEMEYNEAKRLIDSNPLYKIFVFWSDDENEKDDFANTENLEDLALENFYNKAKDQNASFIHPFTTPDNLCKQILLTFNHNFKKKISASDYKECLLQMDRVIPSSVFKKKFKKRTNSFCFVSDNENSPNDFINRIFHVDIGETGYKKCHISLSKLKTLDKSKFELFFNIFIEKAWSIDTDEYVFTGNERLFLTIEITDIEIQNNEKLHLLEQLLLEFLPTFLLTENSNPSSNLFFIFFSYEEYNISLNKQYETFIRNLKKKLSIENCLYDIEELDDVEKDDIREWLNSFVNDKFLENDVDDILRENRQNASRRNSYKMKKANELIIKWLDNQYRN